MNYADVKIPYNGTIDDKLAWCTANGGPRMSCVSGPETWAYQQFRREFREEVTMLEAKLVAIAGRDGEREADHEHNHIEADKILSRIVRLLGYHAAADAFDGMVRWCS